MQPLFVYGTLLEVAVLERLLGRCPPAQPARLRGYRRRAVQGEDYPAILPDDGGVVEGAVLLELDEAALVRLDAYEGPEYVRIRVPVEVLTGVILVWAYVWSESPARLEGEWAVRGQLVV